MFHNKDDLYYRAWRRLPERFRKDNNLNLYYVLYGGYDEIKKAYNGINDSRNIDRAFGSTLDKLGSNVGQFRNGEDDDFYRLLIKTRIIANLSIGDAPTINKVLSILTKDIFINITETWPYERYFNEPAAIVLRLSPKFDKFPYEIVQRIKAAGVRIYFDFIAASNLILKTQYGDHVNPQYLCGEEKCGDIPWEIKADNKVFKLRVRTENYNSKNYYALPSNELPTGLEFEDLIDETVFIQDFSSKDIYEFKDKEW